MEFSKELLDSWNALRHKMRKRDEVQEQMIKVKTALSFPTTGIIGAIAGGSIMNMAGGALHGM